MQDFISPIDRTILNSLLDKLPRETRRSLEQIIKKVTDTARLQGIEEGKSTATQQIQSEHQRGQNEGKLIGTIEIVCRLLCHPKKAECELSKMSLCELQAELQQILAIAAGR